MGMSMVLFSNTTRWWSRWEVMHQIMVQIGDVMPFLTNEDPSSSATHSDLLKIVQNTDGYQLLRVELVAVVEC